MCLPFGGEGGMVCVDAGERHFRNGPIRLPLPQEEARQLGVSGLFCSDAMLYLMNPFDELTEQQAVEAFRLHRGLLVMSEDWPNLEFNRCLFGLPGSFLEMLSLAGDNGGKEAMIPSKEHPLYLIWRCLLHRLISPTTGWVYLLRCREYYKIGITGDLKARLVSYRTENPYPIHLLAAGFVHGYEAIEKEICTFYKHLHHRGEWFRLQHKDVRAIRRALASDGVGVPNPDRHLPSGSLLPPDLRFRLADHRHSLLLNQSITVADLPF